jgi:hypothetical protein
VQYELGGAVHEEDEARVALLRHRMHELDAAIEERTRQARAAIEAAQRRMRTEQGAIAATRVRRTPAG